MTTLYILWTRQTEGPLPESLPSEMWPEFGDETWTISEIRLPVVSDLSSGWAVIDVEGGDPTPGIGDVFFWSQGPFNAVFAQIETSEPAGWSDMVNVYGALVERYVRWDRQTEGDPPDSLPDEAYWPASGSIEGTVKEIRLPVADDWEQGWALMESHEGNEPDIGELFYWQQGPFSALFDQVETSEPAGWADMVDPYAEAPDPGAGTDNPEEWPDIETALRSWLRADPDIQSVVNQRVYFGVPRQTTASSWPMILITRIGGGNQPGEAPMDMPLIQFDVYGDKADEGGGRTQTNTVVKTLRKVLSKMRGQTRLDADTVAWDPRVTTVVFSPLPGDDRPRTMVMAIVPCMKLTAVAP